MSVHTEAGLELARSGSPCRIFFEGKVCLLLRVGLQRVACETLEGTERLGGLLDIFCRYA